MTQASDVETRDEAARVRSYRAGDEKGIIRVLETVFGGWPAFNLNCELIDHWRWRYMEAPGNSAHIFVCEADGEIVGCVHHTLMDMKIEDRIYPGMLAGDIAIFKPFRDQGLLADFTKAAMRKRNKTGHWYSYFETRNPKVIHGFKKSAYHLPLESRHLVRMNDIARHFTCQRHAHRWIKTIAFKSLKLIGGLAHFRQRRSKNKGIKLSQIEAFDQRFDRFWVRISPHYRLIMKRDRRYLNWRYCDARGGNFRVSCAEDEKGLIGYIVLRINSKNSNYPVAYVVDLLCEPGREDAARALLLDGLSYFDSQGVNAVHCLVPRRHPYRKIFAANGFVDTLERTIVFLQENVPMEKQMSSLDQMAQGEAYYSYGDIDTI